MARGTTKAEVHRLLLDGASNLEHLFAADKDDRVAAEKAAQGVGNDAEVRQRKEAQLAAAIAVHKAKVAAKLKEAEAARERRGRA